MLNKQRPHKILDRTENLLTLNTACTGTTVT